MIYYVNEAVEPYESSKVFIDSYIKKLSKYKAIIIGEIHDRAMVSVYSKLLKLLDFDYFICEFAHDAKCLTKEELKEKLDQTTDGEFKKGIPDYQDDYVFYKLAYDNNVGLIGCDLNTGRRYKNMNEEDKARESRMISVLREYIPKGRCLVQIGDHHLRSIPISKEFLEYCHDTKDDRGIYKNIDDLVVNNASPIWDAYNKNGSVLICRVKKEYENEVNFMKKGNK